jgi:RHS repeat-associated protein
MAAGPTPMAVVSGVNTTPTLLMVHVDHLHRPVKMTNAAGASVWSAVWLPWGGAHTITGAESLDARFPGQWYQLEAGLHYNWHRSYDPTLGRYTQPDPLGFVDGPGVYGYAGGDAQARVDKDGRQIVTDDPDADADKISKCALIRIITVTYCKFQNFSCHGILDTCESIKKKINQKNICITIQKLLTSYCFPNSPSHDQRIDDEEKGIERCRRIARQKKCDPSCSAPEDLPPLGPLLGE